MLPPRIMLILLISLSAAAKIPYYFDLGLKPSKEWEEQDRPESNFILDIIRNPYSFSETDSVAFFATGSGFTMGYSTLRPVDELRWRSSVPGYGGSSAISVDRFNNIWMTTAADSFVSDVNAFLPTGSGVHMSADSGRTWTHFPQPGITPIQGLAYDIACDSLGGIWMACFGQSLQKSDDSGQSWRTLTCDQKEWDPFNNMNQRLFSVHITASGKLWAGSAEGINLCENYNVPDSLREWKQFTFSNGLSGNFVTAISSYFNTDDNKEYVFAASWLAENAAEVNGISYTNDNGNSWNKCLLGEKIYSISYRGNDIFACGDNGLWKSSDNGKYWENYSINAWSGIKKDYIRIKKVYSFLYHNTIMFAGTGEGIAISGDDGNSWRMAEAYEPSSDSQNDTYAYPNPFSPAKFGEVKLQFRLKKESQVTCKIFNFAMERVRLLRSSENFESGEHYLTWDGKDDNGKTAANGVYYYIISADGSDLWNKIIIFE
ncbi:MAG TPA: FlgD immunoglobulin-like domain containing protein [Clostridiales bacterium]|mgnify:CR=1 FL=1|nr:FlgD immunoglobulin-like domain containing protein [Clostridiales bacterium]HQP68950.1 FlgD immunoglobulin-like domain containing protein [Clostridiales bacterium]